MKLTSSTPILLAASFVLNPAAGLAAPTPAQEEANSPKPAQGEFDAVARSPRPDMQFEEKRAPSVASAKFARQFPAPASIFGNVAGALGAVQTIPQVITGSGGQIIGNIGNFGGLTEMLPINPFNLLPGGGPPAPFTTVTSTAGHVAEIPYGIATGVASNMAEHASPVFGVPATAGGIVVPLVNGVPVHPPGLPFFKQAGDSEGENDPTVPPTEDSPMDPTAPSDAPESESDPSAMSQSESKDDEEDEDDEEESDERASYRQADSPNDAPADSSNGPTASPGSQPMTDSSAPDSNSPAQEPTPTPASDSEPEPQTMPMGSSPSNMEEPTESAEDEDERKAA